MAKKAQKTLSKLPIVGVLVVIFIMSITSISAQYNRDYFLWVARQHLIKGDYREAITSLNTLIRVDEKAYEGYFLRGIAKYNLGDLLGADGDLTAAITYNPVYTTAYTYRAITRSRLGNYDDALNDFTEAIELRPDLPDPYYSRGVTRLLNQQFNKAIEDFDRFLIQEKRVSEAYINRGICYLQLSDTTKAYENFNDAIRINRNNPDAYNRRGSLYMEQERYNKAESDFDNAIRNDSTHIPSYFNRALVRNNLNRPTLALKDFDKVIELDSASSITYFNRAIMLSQIGDYNKALDDYDHVAELSPNNVLVYFYRANLLSRLGDIESAEWDYSRAIELYPDFANAYLSRSNIRMLLKNTEGAMRDKVIAEQKIAEHKSKLIDSTYSIYSDTTYRFDKLLSFDTKFTGSSFDRGGNGLSIAATQDNDLRLISLFKFTFNETDSTTIRHSVYYDPKLEDFIASFDRAGLTISNRESNIPGDSLAAMERRYERVSIVDKSWDNLFELGIAQSLIKQYTSSISTLTAAIKEESKSPFLYINRSAIRAEMIEFISSIENSFQRITIDSDPANNLKNTTAVSRSYDYKEALEDIETAIALHPDLAYSHYNLAGLLVLSGKLPEAYKAYNEAIRLYPTFAEAYYNRGVVQIMMKDTRKGCIDLSKAGELGIDRAYQLLEKYSKM
ncbi:MAG: tetratricopeptide repeat protein [Rikenellaceae bacterium]